MLACTSIILNNKLMAWDSNCNVFEILDMSIYSSTIK